MFYGQEKSGRMPMLWPSGLPYSVSMQRCLGPDGMAGFELPHHSLQWVSSIWRHFLYSGDRKLLEELFGKAVNALRWIGSKCDSDGLLRRDDTWEDRWDWVDWEGQQDIWASLNLFYYKALNDLKSMAAEMNKAEIVQEAQKRMVRLKAGFVSRYWSEEYQAFVDCYSEASGRYEPFFSEITLSLALQYGLVPDGYEKNVLQRLAGGLPDCSPVHKYHPYITYSMYGMNDRVLKEFRTRWNSMWSIEGTGTFQEVWELDPDSGNSCCCQSASSVPAYYLPAYILGVRPVKPGFEEFVVVPVTAGLDWARGKVPIPNGLVGVEFERKSDGYDMKISVPEGYELVKSNRDTDINWLGPYGSNTRDIETGYYYKKVNRKL
jgi:Glycogen debranching enzyme